MLGSPPGATWPVRLVAFDTPGSCPGMGGSACPQLRRLQTERGGRSFGEPGLQPALAGLTGGPQACFSL